MSEETMSTMNDQYNAAKDAYAALGVDTETALRKLSTIPISIHCWQGDDVGGFETAESELTGGIAVTGNFPGRARTPQELRADFEKTYSLIPGSHRFALHASYLESGGKAVDRDEVLPEHFTGWVEWARSLGIGLDFNPTYFSHPKSDDGFTLAHADKDIRDFWIEHGKRCRAISAYFGREQGTPSYDNFWIADGWKDEPADRLKHRELLIDSLDKIFAEKMDPAHTIDSVESKLFGIGSETYVVGSHEFYLAYALTRHVALTLDSGHFHPTESIAEKISAVLPFIPKILLHVSRPVRWDSDHVVLFNDETRAIAREIARANAWDQVAIGLDFFDGSINRVSAWTIGARNTVKALLFALLEPIDLIRKAENNGRLADRLALQEEAKTLPFGAVWDRYCEQSEVPVGTAWMDEVATYEKNVLLKRG
jgi:L-rhamnose isomerase